MKEDRYRQMGNRRCKAWYTYANQMRICVDGTVYLCCAFAYHLPRTEICCSFAQTQRELGVLVVLCLPQVRRKLIYYAPSVNCSQTVWFACGLQVCTGLKIYHLQTGNATKKTIIFFIFTKITVTDKVLPFVIHIYALFVSIPYNMQY